MSDQLVMLLVILGGAVGLAILGVAFWIMRQENAPAPALREATPSTAETQPAPAGAAIETARPIIEAPPLKEPPPAISSSPASPPPAVKTPDWLGSLASKVSPPAPTPTPPAAGEELLRLWRSSEGDLIVEVNGQCYRSRQEITNYETGQQIANAASDLNYFLNSFSPAPAKATAPPPARSTSPGSPAGEPARPAASQPLTRTPPPASANNRPVVVMTREEAAQAPLSLPSMDIVKELKYLRGQGKKPEIKIKSVMDEINDLVQAKIANTPLAQRGLKIADGPNGGVFSLDGKDYESVDDLPDPEIREVVRTAVQEWDKK